MKRYCTRCLRILEPAGTLPEPRRWRCPKHGIVDTTFATTDEVSWQIKRVVLGGTAAPVHAAVQSEQGIKQQSETRRPKFVKTCRVCKTTFTTANNRYRYCKECLPPYLKRPATQAEVAAAG